MNRPRHHPDLVSVHPFMHSVGGGYLQGPRNRCLWANEVHHVWRATYWLPLNRRCGLNRQDLLGEVGPGGWSADGVGHHPGSPGGSPGPPWKRPHHRAHLEGCVRGHGRLGAPLALPRKIVGGGGMPTRGGQVLAQIRSMSFPRPPYLAGRGAGRPMQASECRGRKCPTLFPAPEHALCAACYKCRTYM